MSKILVYFPVDDEFVRQKLHDSEARCLQVNLQGLPPDCDYNATGYACGKDSTWAPPGQVFWFHINIHTHVHTFACAHHSRDCNLSCLCRYVATAVFVLMILKELVKVGVVLFLLVRRRGKVPPQLGWSAVVVVVEHQVVIVVVIEHVRHTRHVNSA